MLDRIAKILALIVLTINVYFSGIFKGVDESRMFDAPSMFSGGPSIYDMLADYQLFAAFCLFGWVVGKTIKKEFLSQVVSFSSIFLAFYFFRKMYLLKSSYISDLSSTSLITPVHVSFRIDWFLYSIVLLLLIYQIFTIYKYFSGKNHKLN